MREDMAAARESNEARRRELLPVERLLAGYVRHLDGLEQARRDMATLRRGSSPRAWGIRKGQR